MNIESQPQSDTADSNEANTTIEEQRRDRDQLAARFFTAVLYLNPLNPVQPTNLDVEFPEPEPIRWTVPQGYLEAAEVSDQINGLPDGYEVNPLLTGFDGERLYTDEDQLWLATIDGINFVFSWDESDQSENGVIGFASAQQVANDLLAPVANRISDTRNKLSLGETVIYLGNLNDNPGEVNYGLSTVLEDDFGNICTSMRPYMVLSVNNLTEDGGDRIQTTLNFSVTGIHELFHMYAFLFGIPQDQLSSIFGEIIPRSAPYQILGELVEGDINDASKFAELRFLWLEALSNTVDENGNPIPLADYPPEIYPVVNFAFELAIKNNPNLSWYDFVLGFYNKLDNEIECPVTTYDPYKSPGLFIDYLHELGVDRERYDEMLDILTMMIAKMVIESMDGYNEETIWDLYGSQLANIVQVETVAETREIKIDDVVVTDEGYKLQPDFAVIKMILPNEDSKYVTIAPLERETYRQLVLITIDKETGEYISVPVDPDESVYLNDYSFQAGSDNIVIVVAARETFSDPEVALDVNVIDTSAMHHRQFIPSIQNPHAAVILAAEEAQNNRARANNLSNHRNPNRIQRDNFGH